MKGPTVHGRDPRWIWRVTRCGLALPGSHYAVTDGRQPVTCRTCRRHLGLPVLPLDRKPLAVPWAERLRAFYEATSRTP